MTLWNVILIESCGKKWNFLEDDGMTKLLCCKPKIITFAQEKCQKLYQ